MSFPAIQEFQRQFAHSAELRKRIKGVQSLPEMMAVLQSLDIHLTGEELRALAQAAFDHWLALLSPVAQGFFIQARQDKTLNVALESCKTVDDVLRLAKSYGHHLTEVDLQEAAQVAGQIEGFSFEKLWFKGLGLLPA